MLPVAAKMVSDKLLESRWQSTQEVDMVSRFYRKVLSL
jgi:hypothetical protein